jgi:hypothetical protein
MASLRLDAKALRKHSGGRGVFGGHGDIGDESECVSSIGFKNACGAEGGSNRTSRLGPGGLSVRNLCRFCWIRSVRGRSRVSRRHVSHTLRSFVSHSEDGVLTIKEASFYCRVPEVGDKFSTLQGQKSVIGAVEKKANT